ncbi:hypothetical protein WJX72_006968 [[Myrmecia] bisecta]|uniref:Uncharacterized protein n=1 Tax=[Myrmecia] bisecta TaxID=41462 RepID=A0AAW1R7S7_9CHLO
MVETEEGSEYKGLKAADCPLQNERDDTVDDLVKSDFLHEPGILHTLRVRYTLDMIYTYSGNILIAANPHKRLRHLYGARMMTQYRGVPLGELSPHVYAIAEQAFTAMMIDEQRQAILISGESGAGKTESAKMVMQYLAHRTAPLQSPEKRSHKPKAGAAEDTAPIEEQVLESNPLLEAFGNAKTVRNDNSSRFGKFVEINFDVAGRVTGAAISTYLLERSRVVSVNSPERSYHIFYQLCAGSSADQRKRYRLECGAQGFSSLNRSETFTLADVDDAEAFRSTLDAMSIIGLSEQDQEAVLSVVAAVLHLSNLRFTQSGSDEAQLADEAARETAAIVASLLQVSPEALVTALTTRAIETMGERIIKSLDAAAANESRDSLAKNLYARLFDWLVAAINRKISALGSGQRSHRTIGILDIYGFESFVENSFEQLCINLANERLQQQFNQHVFKGEQEEYAREGIDWSYVEFIDNQDCLDLLEGPPSQPSLAVFPLIDEACRLPRATYQDLAHTLRTRLADAARFTAPKRPQHGFAVEHYAGRVTYSTTRLLDKNKDFTIAEHAQLLASSASEYIRLLFEERGEVVEAAPAKRGGKSAYKLNSVGARFRKQLQGLMATLNHCQPHYIRCIKPNPESRPGSLAPEYALDQLRAGGVLEAVRIACAGYPTRKPFRPFAQRYAILAGGGRGSFTPLDMAAVSEEEAAEVARRVLQAVKLEGWQIGKTRVFLRAGQLAQLEGARGLRLTASAITIQAVYRGVAARRLLAHARASATKVQAAWRGTLGRRVAAERRREVAATRIQTCWRMHHQRAVYQHQKRERKATIIQSYVRMHLVRTRFRRETEAGKKAAARAEARARRDAAAVTIQKHVRRRAATKKVAALRQEAVKWQTLQAERDSLTAQVAAWRSKYESEASRSSELAASACRLESELAAAHLEAQAARAASLHAGQHWAVEVQDRDVATVEASKVIQLEAAQAAAQAALMAEMALLRRQKGAAEEHAAGLEGQVGELQAHLKAKRSEVDEMLAAAAAKDRENSKLWEQVRAAAEEYHEEFNAKELAIAALTAEAEETRVRMQAEIEKLRTEMEAEVAAVKEAMQRRVEEAVAESESRGSGLRESREKNVHFSARVVSLNARVAQLQKQVKEGQAREKALMEELEASKKAAAAGPQPPPQLRMENGRVTPARTVATLRNLDIPDASPSASTPPQTPDPAVLDREHEACLGLMLAGVVERRLSIVQIQHGLTQADSIGMPVAAWLLGECLLNWALRWRAQEVDMAALRMRDSILSTAETEGLIYQAYMLSTTLALGAFLKVRSIGKRDCSNLFKLGDEMIQFQQLHQLLALSVADMLPVDVSQLLSEDAKRQARQGALRRNSSGAAPDAAPATKSIEGLMNSPWKGLLGGLSNVLETLRGEGAPPPACRAVVYASLRYVDAELLNALVLRRDCCSISAIKALQAGLADVKAWVAYMGSLWCGEVAEAERALEHSGQAVRYLLGGKDDCVRKATKGFDITPDLRRVCPSLTLQQVYKLTEHHHDDWIMGNLGTDTLALLEALKRAVDAQCHSQPPSPASSANGTPFDAGHHFSTPGSRVSMDDEDSLLLDATAAFVLPRKLLTDAARYFVQAPRPYHSAAPGVSLLDRIESVCRRNVQLPRQLRDRPEFAFLQ